MRYYRFIALVFFFMTLAVFPVSALTSYEEAEKSYKKGDFEAALSALRPLAEKGDSRAQYSLGLMYAKGEGLPSDLFEAFVWTSMAEQSAKDQFYSARSSILLDKVKAKLGKDGLVQAQERLQKRLAAIADRKENPVKISMDSAKTNLELGNFDQGIKEYTALAEQGNLEATSILGDLYLSGKGTEADLIEAMKWFKKGAEAGNRDCLRSYGVLLLNGHGGEMNDPEGIKMIARAAEMGDPPSMMHLATLFWDGRGVAENHNEAFFWYYLAAEQGIEEAVAKVQGIKQELPEEQVEAAKKRVADWQPKKP